MKIKGAMTILVKRAEWYGKSFEWLIDFIERNPMVETEKVTEAYNVFKAEMQSGLKEQNLLEDAV